MTVEQHSADGVTTVRLLRPEARNAVDPEHAHALWQAFVAFDRDPQARVAVFAGTAQAFCAGFDLKALAGGRARSWMEKLHFGTGAEPPLGPMGPTRLRLSKPVIAAIEGPAVAGGMELALWCDLRVMAETAYMGVYCRRFGVPLIDGGTVRLPRVVGAGRAAELILSGRRIEAPECLHWGLANRLCESGEALATAQAWARELAALPQTCLRADHASAQAAWGDELAALRAEFEGAAHTLEEAAAGAARFARGAGRHGGPADA